MKKYSFRIKILMSISACILIFCLLSSLMISSLLGNRLFRKSETIDKEYAGVILEYLQDIYENVNQVGAIVRSNSYVTRAMSYSSLNTTNAMYQALKAQERMDVYLSACPVEAEVSRMLIFNRAGVLITGTSIVGHQDISAERLMKSEMFLKHQDTKIPAFEVTTSIADGERDVLAYLYPLDRENLSFLYMEFDTKILTHLLEPYEESANIMIESTGISSRSWYASEALQAGMTGEDPYFRLSDYRVNEFPFPPFHLVVKTMTQGMLYSNDNVYIIYTLLITLVTVMATGFVVSRQVSNRISKPLNELAEHIVSLSGESELRENAAIEKGSDEVAAIGRGVNRLVRHINGLILRQKEMYEQKQQLEIDALQAQINPHFLYNTLDSIRWMAVIQKSETIARTVGALENLLRNMAKGVGGQITLQQELSLTQDYVSLQQVRYMEIFDYICEIPETFSDVKIVKMTLQPIIENAILHGIEPTGSYGEIRVSAHEEAGDLLILVEDNGAGMDEEELTALKTSLRCRNKNSMSGIGVSNVDARLRMIYGERYGLHYESEKNRFTRVTVRIPCRHGGESNAAEG